MERDVPSLEKLGLYDVLEEVLQAKMSLHNVLKKSNDTPDVHFMLLLYQYIQDEKVRERLGIASVYADLLLTKIDAQTYLGSPKYTYHNKAHTMEQVVPMSLLLLEQQNLLLQQGGQQPFTDRDKELLVVAALFHDTGFLVKYIDNEWIGAHIARHVMHHMGNYTEDDMQRVEACIMATQVHRKEGNIIQSARENDLLAQIVCDADLSHRAGDIARVRTTLLNLVIEKMQCGETINEQAMRINQTAIMRGHNYCSPAGHELLAPGKEQNIQAWEKGFS